MIIFKSFFRIVRRNYTTMIVPLVLFIGFAFVSNLNATQQAMDLTTTKPKAVILNHDSELGASLLDYLSTEVELVDTKSEDLQQVIFYRQAYFALEIPSGYTRDFLSNGTELKAEMEVNSSMGYIVQTTINQYLSSYKALRENGHSHAEAAAMLIQANATQTTVTVIGEAADSRPLVLNSFANLAMYPMFITIMSVIVYALYVFDKSDIYHRTQISSMRVSSRNIQLFSAAFLVGNLIWIFMIALGGFLMRDNIDLSTLPYTLLNSYVYFLFALSFAFLTSKIAKTPAAQTAITNSVGLGLSFICGVFVPIHVMSSAIQTVAKFLPVYWSVEVNRLIMEGSVGFNQLGILLSIVALYSLGIVCIAILISRNTSAKTL